MDISQEDLSQNQRRVVIQKIILNNFKSYKGEKIIGPFHHRFSCIIGPNGSGKSNLVDSLVFVFGKKAAWMRVKYLKELIHNSDNQECQQASVTVYFQEIIDNGEDKMKLIEGTQFNIRRSVNKKSESQFFLNGQKLTQKKIIELLKQKNIDLEKNRFMILQGEVEQIALMKPKSGNMDNPGLLEYLEDIIGSDQYVEDIEKLEQLLDSCQFKRIESNDKIYGLKKRVEELKKKKDKALNYLEKEKYVFQLKNFLEQIQMHNINIQIQEIVEIRVKYENDQKNLLAEISHKFESYNEHIEKVKVQKKILEKKNQEIRKLNDKSNELKLNYQELTKLSKKNNLDKQQIEEDLQKLGFKLNKCIDEIGELKEQFDELTNQYNTKEQRKNELFYQIEQQKPQYEQKINEIEKLITNQEKVLLKLSEEKNLLVKKKMEIEQEKQQIENKLKENKVKYERQKMEQNNCQETIKKAEENRIDSEKEEQAIQNIINKNQQNLVEIKNVLKNLQNKIKDIRDNIEMVQNTQQKESQNVRIHQQLMDAQSQNKLTGLIGRFGDLVAIQKEYALPICAVSENFANSIVTKTVEDAQKALDYLKRNRIGQMKFWALDQIRDYSELINKKFNTPKNSKRIFDIINYKKQIHPRFESLIYYLFKDILITKDLQTAKLLAYNNHQRREVVTMNGCHINRYGLLSKKQHQNTKLFTNSLMLTSEEQQNLNKLKKQSAQLQQEYYQIAAQKNKIEKVINNNQDQVKNYKQKKEYYQSKFIELTNDLHKLEQSNEDLKQNDLQLQQQLQIIQQNYDNELIYQNINDCQQKIEIEDQKKEKLQRKKLKIGSKEFQNLMKEYTILEQEVDDIKKMIIDNKGKKSFQEAEQKLLLEQKTRLKVQLEELDKEKDEIKMKIAQIVQQAQTYNSENQELDIQRIKLEKKCDQLAGGLEELNKYIQEKKKIKKQIKDKIDKCSEDIDYNKDKIKKFEQNLKEIRDNYEQSLQQYNFLQQIDEIEKLENNNESKQDQSILQKEEVIKEEKQKDEEQKDSRRKYHRNNNWEFIKQVDVMEKFSDHLLSSYQDNNQKLSLENNIKNEEQILKNMAPQLDVLVQYKNQLQEYLEKEKSHREIKEKELRLQTKLFSLKDKRKAEFTVGLNFISKKMKEIYKTFAKGGDAELEALENGNPFSKGIVFSVKPFKTWCQISVLSGGQKTLVSLSFIYALHYYKPNCIYFMDEIDAALDYKNRGLVGEFIKNRTKEAQFIVISLRNEMFEKSDLLVGVYKNSNISKTVSLNIKQTMKKIKISKDEKIQNSD